MNKAMILGDGATTAPHGGAPVLELKSLNVWFDTGRDHNGTAESHVVRGIDLTIAAGERVGLVGESGCGKTTTILAAMGLLPASAIVSGEVILDGESILAGGESGIQPHRWRDIAMVFQGAMSAFNPVKTIGWQIQEAVRFHNMSRRPDAASRVTELLGLVGLAPENAHSYPHQLSGGMKQRAMIAMALACDPKVLLADEPTTALDVVVQDQILQLLVRLSEELNLALVLVTHDLGVVAQTCTRAAVMLEGKIIEEGAVDDLYRRPQHPYTRSLFEATPSLADTQRDPRAGVETARHLLDVKGITTVYTRQGRSRKNNPAGSAVDNVSLHVDEGELVALVGQSGCGKTTTIHNIMGMVPVEKGSITINGTEVTTLSGRKWRTLRRDVQMIYQDPYESLDVRFRVSDTVEEPLLIHRIGRSKAERLDMVNAALSDVGLPAENFAQRYPHELSGGQRQRVAIAASLVLKPRLLLADEPVSMLDVSVRTGILELVNRLRHEHQVGILMITHDLSTAAKYADRIIVMRGGRIVEIGEPWQIINSPQSEYTRKLIESVPSPDPRPSRSGRD